MRGLLPICTRKVKKKSRDSLESVEIRGSLQRPLHDVGCRGWRKLKKARLTHDGVQVAFLPPVSKAVGGKRAKRLEI